MRDGYGIGELSERSGLPVATIRYYESLGILPRAARNSGGQRRFGAEDLKRLTFVRDCRGLGYSLKRVLALVELSHGARRTCDEARDLAVEQLAIVRRRIGELQALEDELAAQVADCDKDCAHGPAADCSIFTRLGEDGPRQAGCCAPPPLVLPATARPRR
jgi:DNA-binding transcriptional MerR regulator